MLLLYIKNPDSVMSSFGIAAAAAYLLQSCPSACDPRDCSLFRLLCPWDSLGKSSGLSCHALLQGFFPTQGWNPGLPHCNQILYHLSHQGNPPLTLVLSFSTSLRMLKVENNDDAELKSHFFIALGHEIQKYLTLTSSPILLSEQSHW